MRCIGWKRYGLGDGAIDDKKLIMYCACEVSNVVKLAWSIESVKRVMLLMDESGVL